MESKPAGEQWQLAADWMRRLARQRLTHGRLPEADDQRLADFFENELSDEQRDRLLAMPGEEMQQTLQRMYMTRMKPPAAAGHRYHHQPPPADARERK